MRDNHGTVQPSKGLSTSIMSSGFVSGGSLEKPIERDDEWKKAQQELEENRKKKAELEKQHEGKSLFEVLQTNKGCYPLDPHTTLFHLG